MVRLVLDFCTDDSTVVKIYLEGECPEGSEDSDCEGVPEPSRVSSPDAQVDEKEGKEPESLPVLAVGSFARYAQTLPHGSSCVNFFDSWRSLFFYICTDVIQFARLRSQGIDVRARYVQKQTTPGKPPPCSPKVIYSLATAVSSDIHAYCGPKVTQRFPFSLRLRHFVILRSMTYVQRSPPRT